ncbi:alpha/beta hydrolase family protein [Streptomyces nanshensis]|uniref:alpha/beta hydrolase family protein n=1 Tax=Streptomyces nanshensis TaxID=518642 RepID=UPI00085BF74B|nr:alpha/beta hydrolase [Streptomyces nanshensis]
MSRISEQRMERAQEQLRTISEEDHQKVKALAGIVRPLRSVIHKTPDDHGMTEWRDVYFPSDDGTPLEGWYIPAKGGQSDKLVIFNHALPMCRSGFPGHLGEPWSGYDAVEIDFVLQMKHLTDAGYNVLAYDIRNHGNSSAANGGLSGIGRWEWRDCVGAKKYVDAHPELSGMRVGLYSQCMGGNSQYEAIYRRPGLFADVACMCSPMVVSMSAIFSAFSELQGISRYEELIDLELLKMGAFTADEMTPQLFAEGVTMPVLMIQVLEDAWTRNPEDAQKTFDLLGSQEKELVWIENTTRRFRDGYNYFGRHPEKVIPFFDAHMK